MDSERWRRIEELFHAALTLEPKSQQTFLCNACGADAELRRELESLLAQGEKAGSFLETHSTPAESVATGAALLGRQFGPYRIVEPLGAGGMGEVYRAYDSQLGREVALKTLPAAFARDPERLARLRREARTLASLNHPNIATIHGLEESGGAIYLVLELVEGEALCGPVPVKLALDYARQIAEAIEAAHAKGIIHRDLKPANVKVTDQGHVKVLDFGLAKAVQDGNNERGPSRTATTDGGETQAGQIVGTAPYMSPEQACGKVVDQRADVWAFGCVLYELLAGKRAFAGESLPDTIASVLNQEPDWSALPKKTPARIRALLRRCLEKTAARRLPDIRSAREGIGQAQRGLSRGRYTAIALTAVVSVGTFLAIYLRNPSHAPGRSEWVQLTNFPDAVSQPALSPEGRTLTFVRGPETFAAPGEIYVKPLPDGEPVQLTRDGMKKMSPVFSPDGSRIAYTVVAHGDYVWDTWVVPLIKGEPRLWLANASGLVWLDPRRILFSEVRQDIHMGIVTADENRAGNHGVYLPAGRRGMAHRSYPSPDRKWAVVVEMDRGNWLPCRLVPVDGSSPGNPVGPRNGVCTFAGWSPDGKWMYLNSSAGGGYHIWRQRFPDGVPEQVTSGPTEEEGIAIRPDGRSLITSVGLRQSVVLVHGPGGERQVSREGFSYDPKFTPDGKKLCYRILKGVMVQGDPSELRIVDLDSARDEPLLPGLPVFGQTGLAYDISIDGKQIVAAARDREGKARLWLAAMDQQSPPRQIPNVEGDYPHFGANGDIFYRAIEGPSSAFVYRVSADGTRRQKMLEQPVAGLRTASPDGRWFVARVQTEVDSKQIAFPLGGGGPVLINTGSAWYWKWSNDQKLLYVSVPESSMAMLTGRTYVIPLAPDRTLPPIPNGGFQADSDLAKLPGVRTIDLFDVAPGPTPDVYAFSRASVQRNLYRIPLE